MVPDDSAVDTSWSVALVAVSEGSFTMGCDPGRDPACDPDELPAHPVSVSAFGIMETELSHAAWQACVDDGVCGELLLPPGADRRPQLPVTGLTRTQAELVCGWAGLRLPTEAEWEWAARGDDGRLYPWGDAAPDCTLANGRSCGAPLLPVRSLEAGASPVGALHMSGNAWEWVSDGYDADYYQDSPEQDPTGPDTSALDQLRGVAIYSSDAALRASNRQVAVEGMTCPLCGVRCAGEAP